MKKSFNFYEKKVPRLVFRVYLWNEYEWINSVCCIRFFNEFCIRMVIPTMSNSNANVGEILIERIDRLVFWNFRMENKKMEECRGHHWNLQQILHKNATLDISSMLLSPSSRKLDGLTFHFLVIFFNGSRKRPKINKQALHQ